MYPDWTGMLCQIQPHTQCSVCTTGTNTQKANARPASASLSLTASLSLSLSLFLSPQTGQLGLVGWVRVFSDGSLTFSPSSDGLSLLLLACPPRAHNLIRADSGRERVVSEDEGFSVRVQCRAPSPADTQPCWTIMSTRAPEVSWLFTWGLFARRHETRLIQLQSYC